jgi:hypothetical protein
MKSALIPAALVWVALTSPGNTQATSQVPGGQREIVPQATPPNPDESLSRRLSRTEGVIKPPAGIDPEIRVPAPNPNPNTTPVIPPPGSPGADQSIQPK